MAIKQWNLAIFTVLLMVMGVICGNVVQAAAIPEKHGAISAEITEHKTAGGAKFWLMEDHRLPIVTLRITFTGSGYAYDPQGKGGLASFVRTVLDNGGGKLSRYAFKKRLEEKAIGLAFDMDEDNFTLSIKSLKENLPEALALATDALTAPHLDEATLERAKGELYTVQLGEQEDPKIQALYAFRRQYFGSHPYGKLPNGEKQTVASLSRSDIEVFLQNKLTRSRAIINVAGDVTPRDMVGMLEKMLASLPTGGKNAALAALPPYQFTGASEQLIDNRAIPQAEIVFGMPSMMRNDPDYYALFVLNYIVGEGQFESRLMQEVREKRGLVYTVDTSLGALAKAGIFQGYAASRNDKMAETARVIKDELQRVYEQGVTMSELADAKRYLTLSFPLRFDRNEIFTLYMTRMQLDNLGMDYLQKRNNLIESVTLEQINHVAKRYIDPKKLVVTIVGNKETIAPSSPKAAVSGKEAKE